LQHFAGQALHFNHYILEDVTEDSRMFRPFDTDVEDLADDISSTAGLQQQLTEIQNDPTSTNRITECVRDQRERKRNQIGGMRLCMF
jgi:hypothetical protein